MKEEDSAFQHRLSQQGRQVERRNPDFYQHGNQWWEHGIPYHDLLWVPFIAEWHTEHLPTATHRYKYFGWSHGPLQSAGCLFARWRGVGREVGRGEQAVLSPGEGGARAVRLQRDYLVPSVGTLPRWHPAGKGPLEGNADPFGQPVHYTALTALQGYLLTITVWHIKGKKKLCKDLRPVDKPFSLSGFPVSGGLCVLGNRSTETRTQKLCTQVWPWDFWSQFYFRGQCQGAELCGTPGRWDLAGRGHATLHTTGAGDASVLPTLTLNIRAHSAELHLTCSTSILIPGCLLVFLCSEEESVIKPKYFSVCSGQTRSGDPAVSRRKQQAGRTGCFLPQGTGVCVYI